MFFLSLGHLILVFCSLAVKRRSSETSQSYQNFHSSEIKREQEESKRGHSLDNMVETSK